MFKGENFQGYKLGKTSICWKSFAVGHTLAVQLASWL